MNKSRLIEGRGMRGEVHEDDDLPFFGFDPVALDHHEAASRIYKTLIKSLEHEISDIQGVCSRASLVSMDSEQEEGSEEVAVFTSSSLVPNDKLKKNQLVYSNRGNIEESEQNEGIEEGTVFTNNLVSDDSPKKQVVFSNRVYSGKRKQEEGTEERTVFTNNLVSNGRMKKQVVFSNRVYSEESKQEDGTEEGTVTNNLVPNDKLKKQLVLSNRVYCGESVQEEGTEEETVFSNNLVLNDKLRKQVVVFSNRVNSGESEQEEGTVLTNNLVPNDKVKKKVVFSYRVYSGESEQEEGREDVAAITSSSSVPNYKLKLNPVVLSNRVGSREEGERSSTRTVGGANKDLCGSGGGESGSSGVCSGERGGSKETIGLTGGDCSDGVSSRSNSDLAWSFGSLVWEIFNPQEPVANASSNPLQNIPVNLVAFYKKCLNKNPLKRPSANMIQELLLSCQYEKKIVKDLKASDVDTGRSNIDLVEACANESWVERDRETEVGDRLVISELSRVGSGHDSESLVSEEACDGDRWSDKNCDGDRDESVGSEIEKKRYICSICCRKYIYKTHLKRHMIASHKSSLEEISTKKLYQCRLCNRSYTRRYHLTRHVDKKHVSSGQNSYPNRLLAQLQPQPLSPYEKFREDNIREKMLFLESLNRET